jgi:hypothetical protein
MGVRKGGKINIRLNPNTKMLRITGLNYNTKKLKFLTLKILEKLRFVGSALTRRPGTADSAAGGRADVLLAN